MIFGVDVSNHQNGIDLHAVRRAGFDFAICKVTEGGTYRSPDWWRQRDQARDAGLILAGYHYIREGDPHEQAASCRAHLGDPTIPVCLDLEKGGGDARQYGRVLDAFRAAGLHVPLSYIPRWYWESVGSPSLTGFPPLWASRYPSMSQGTAVQLYQAVEQAGGSLSKYWGGYGGQTVQVLQFASTALAAGRVIDANAFLGTRAQLVALLGGASQPSEEDDMTPEQEAMVARVEQKLDLLLSQMVYGDDGHPANPGTWGWPGWPGGTGEQLTVVDRGRRLDVETVQTRADIQDVRQLVTAGMSTLARQLGSLAASVQASGQPEATRQMSAVAPRAVDPPDSEYRDSPTG